MLWAAIGLMTLAVVVIVVTPLIRQRAAAADRDFDAAVYRDQLGEADRDVERGLLSAEEAEAAKAEISRRLLKTFRCLGRPAAARFSWAWNR